MTQDDWILALHLLSAFAMVAAIVLFWVAVFVVRRTELPEQMASVARLMPVGTAAVGIGSIGTIVFGIWLAISLDNVKVWDGWVIAAIILWAITAEVGRRSDVAYQPALARARELVAAGQTAPNAELTSLARTSRGLMLHSIATVALLLILIDMIWKPGA